MIDYEDPRNWTKQYVSSHRVECLRFLREINVGAINHLERHQYYPAFMIMCKVSKGLDALLKNEKNNRICSCIAAHSCAIAEFLMLADPAVIRNEMRNLGIHSGKDPFLPSRENAIIALEDAQYFATSDKLRTHVASMARALKAGATVESICKDYALDFPESIQNILLTLDDNFFVPEIRQYAPDQCVVLDKKRLLLTRKVVGKDSSYVPVDYGPVEMPVDTSDKMPSRSNTDVDFDTWVQMNGWDDADLKRVYKKVKFRRNVYGILCAFPLFGIIVLPFWIRAIFLTKAIRYRSTDVGFNIFTKIIFFIYGIPSFFIYPIIMGYIIKRSNWGMGLGDKRGYALTVILMVLLIFLFVRSLNIITFLHPFSHEKDTIHFSDNKENFSDVADVTGMADNADDSHYAEEVEWAVKKNILNDADASAFSPDEICTIAEVLTFLYRASNSPQVDDTSADYLFNKVSIPDHYHAAVAWAVENGLVSGITLDPFVPCTRGMVVTYLWKLAGSPVNSDYVPYTISDQTWTGDCTIDFEAAFVKEVKVTLYNDSLWWGGYDENGEGFTYVEQDENGTETNVTLVIVRPGSKFNINSGYYGYDFDEQVLDCVDYWLEDGTLRTISNSDMGNCESFFGGNLSYGGIGHGEQVGSLIYLNQEKLPYFIMYPDFAAAVGLLSAEISNFSDVPIDSSSAHAVTWAVNRGIATGTGATTFSPDEVCTRGQIITFLYRAFNK